MHREVVAMGERWRVKAEKESPESEFPRNPRGLGEPGSRRSMWSRSRGRSLSIAGGTAEVPLPT